VCGSLSPFQFKQNPVKKYEQSAVLQKTPFQFSKLTHSTIEHHSFRYFITSPVFVLFVALTKTRAKSKAPVYKNHTKTSLTNESPKEADK
jgi:hypothetical protein